MASFAGKKIEWIRNEFSNIWLSYSLMTKHSDFTVPMRRDTRSKRLIKSVDILAILELFKTDL